MMDTENAKRADANLRRFSLRSFLNPLPATTHSANMASQRGLPQSTRGELPATKMKKAMRPVAGLWAVYFSAMVSGVSVETALPYSKSRWGRAARREAGITLLTNSSSFSKFLYAGGRSITS